jgi:hypothetical protein
MKKIISLSAGIAVLFFISFTACKKEKLLTDSNATLEFSDDTVAFDTVFTSVGSATQVFTVVNNYDQPVKIGSLYIASGNSSNYRLNVNGSPGKSFTDVEIGANDSIWIFVEVTVDPNSGTTPLIVEDAIIFITNGHQQNVILEAYGQDAHFFPSSNCGEERSQCTPLFKLKNCPGGGNIFHWTNDKPYVIYGYAILDAGCTLTIDPGVRVHFHNNSGLIITSSAKLIVNGTAADPVIFQGDRLGADYQDVPGQWDRIWFSNIASIDLSVCPVSEGITSGPGSYGNEINYAIIKNGYVGVQADTSGSSTDETVEINNTIIKNCASTAFYGNGSFVSANNSVFANCGEFLSYLSIGGLYKFLHCTFANYWSHSNRSTPSMVLNDYYVDVNGVLNIRPITAYFGNCIVYGNQDTEIGFDTVPTGNYVTLIMNNCLMKIDNETYSSSSNFYNQSTKDYRNQEPKFKDIDNNYYRTDSTSSPAIDHGDLSITNSNPLLGSDIEGKNRPDLPTLIPDIGAYESDNQ